MLEAYQAISDGLMDAEVEEPADFTQNVMRRIAPAIAALPEARPNRRPQMRRFIAAAAMLVLVAGVGFAAIWGGANEASPVATAAPAAPYAAAPDFGVQRRVAEAHMEADSGGGLSCEYGDMSPAEMPFATADIQPEDAVEDCDRNNIDILAVPPDSARPLSIEHAFFDSYFREEPWIWSELSQALRGAGHDYEYDGDTFSVADPYNPGSYLHGLLAEHPERPGERIVTLIGYRVRQGDAVREVKLYFDDGAVWYYYGPCPVSGDSVRVEDLICLRNFLLFGYRR